MAKDNLKLSDRSDFLCQQFPESRLVQNPHAKLFRLFQFASGFFAGQQIARFFTDAAAHLAAAPGFKNTIWVITGTLSQSRDEIAELIRTRGGKVSGSVSKKTSYVLAGEEAGSKLEKAKKLGVRLLNENDFRELLES